MSDKQQEEQSTESEFDKAFNEAAAEGHIDQGEQSNDESDTSAEEREEEAGESDEESQESQDDIDWRAKAEEEQRAREQAEQRMNSWDGRLRKSSEELTTTRKQLEEERKAREQLEKRLSSLEHRSVEGDRKKLEEWIEEYGHLEDLSHVTEIVRKQLKAFGNKDDSGDEPDTGKQEPTGEQDAADEQDEEDRLREEALKAQQAHINAISAKHADWAEHVGALDDWIKTLPGEDALKYARIKERGNADEVVAMLDAYKSSKRGGNKQTNDDADAMAAVRHRSSGRRPKALADKNDFDAAWDEAVGQSR